jgi:hypothetical protein
MAISLDMFGWEVVKEVVSKCDCGWVRPLIDILISF